MLLVALAGGPAAAGEAVLRGTVAPAAAVPGDVRTALSRAPSLEASRARAEAAEHDARAARGALLPKLSLLADVDIAGAGLDLGETAGRNGRAGLSLSVPLFSSGAALARLRAARASRDAAGHGVEAERRAIALRAATARMDVARMRRAVRALGETVDGLSLLVDSARTLRRAGEVGLTDVAFAEANLGAARGELAAGREGLARARLAYRTLVGHDAGGSGADGSGAGEAHGSFERLVPRDVEAAVVAALGSDPTLLAGRLDAEAGRHRARAALGALGPQLDLAASVDRGHDWNAATTSDWNTGIGLRLRMPLGDAEGWSRARAAEARAREGEWMARDAARAVERALRETFIAHRAAGQKARAARARATRLAHALDATRAEYRVGLKTVADVTEVELDLARARIAQAAARRDRDRAAFAIGLATGRVRARETAGTAGRDKAQE